MLQLSLEQGDYVVIGDNVKVRFSHLNERNRNLAVLSFDAPRDVSIVRGTAYEKMLHEMADEGDAEALIAIQKVQEAQDRYESRRQENSRYHNQRRYEKLQEKRRLRAAQ